jgi:hypothetical protein
MIFCNTRMLNNIVREEMEKSWSLEDEDDEPKKSYKPPIKTDTGIPGYQ